MWVVRLTARTLYGLAEILLSVTLVVLVAGAVVAFRLGHSVSPVLVLPEVQRVRTAFHRLPTGAQTYLRSVQPGWWLTRGLVIAAPTLMFHEPSILWIVLLLGVAAVAVWAGPKTRTDRRWLWVSVPITGFAVGTLLLLAIALAGSIRNNMFYYLGYW
jgi:hypothetical protein